MFQCWFLNVSKEISVSNLVPKGKEISVSMLVPKCQQGNKCFQFSS